LRARLDAIAARRGVERLHRDPATGRSGVGGADSAARSKRIVRALEVYFITGRP
jgi:tRNA A37 N6-isopentenylltransferase MiaA